MIRTLALCLRRRLVDLIWGKEDEIELVSRATPDR